MATEVGIDRAALGARKLPLAVAAGAVLQVDATTLTRSTSRGAMARQLVADGLATIMAADNHGDGRSMLLGRRYLEERGAKTAATSSRKPASAPPRVYGRPR